MRECLCIGTYLAAAVFSACAGEQASADGSKLLWQIGRPDQSTAELALAPDRYADFADDPLFVVGLSDPKRDWPYAHPGPTDVWAGNRQHAFTIAFGVKRRPSGGICRLQVELADTHDRMPPNVQIRFNGRRLATLAMPRGGPDDSIMGEPAKGRPHRFTVELPTAEWKPGTNEVTLRTLSGSWILYDWIGLETPAELEAAPVEPTVLLRAVDGPPLLTEKGGRLYQTLRLSVLRVGPPAEATLALAGGRPLRVPLRSGRQEVELPVPAVEAETQTTVHLELDGRPLLRRNVVLRPVRKWLVYLLPHSHVDIGYTQLQSRVEQDHWRFYEQAIEASRRTADYPPGAQFKWNVEVLWATDSYLKQASAEKRQQFIEAVRKGWIGLDALYGNQLTALCRPEELVRLVDYAQRLARACGVRIDSAMISDVPGYTWGLTSVLGEAGVKYFSIGPNSGARIGFTHQVWDEKPFYWISPCGRHRLLCWIPKSGYYRAFAGERQLIDHLRQLEQSGYPYDVVQVRYCLGDNHGPAFELCETVKDFNARYAYPKLIIGTTSEMMGRLERLHGSQIPEFRGDFTPYWEDGAASSARETGINRASAERLSQAEALWAMLRPQDYPADEFYAAWRNVLLYDEHTWGAHNSISEPDSQFAKEQWAVKQGFALQGAKQSRALLREAAGPLAKRSARVEAVYVLNTSSWPRTDLVVLPKRLRPAGSRVSGPDGERAASQRLSDGRLAFVAREVPPFGAKRFHLGSGDAEGGGARAQRDRVYHAGLTAVVDEKTGAVRSLRARGIDAELVDGSSGLGLNDYFYVPGKDPKAAERCGPVEIVVKEPGPLVASLLVRSEAPGCRSLSREIRLIDGIDRLDLIDIVDKEKIRTKEGVHFAFAFNVPQGVIRMDIPWAVMRPEVDQLPGACKNWFTVQRWVDTSNEAYGVTWATVDAPLVEVGSITAETPWIEKLEPTQTFYSYVMNNYWFTNYKADQEGPTRFRYSLRPHVGRFDALEASRFGIERSQPLVAVPASDGPAVIPSRLKVDPPEVIVATLKPSRDRQAWIVRLFGLGQQTSKATLTWSDPRPKRVCLSDLSEQPGTRITGPIDVPAQGLVTLRAELPD